MRLLFIINPSSGRDSNDAAVLAIHKSMAESGFDFKFLYTTGKDDNDAIDRQLSEYKPDRIVACGGDGTVQLVARNIIGKKIPMGIMPLGSANGLAKALDLPSDLEQILHVFTHGTRQLPLDLLMVNNNICTHLSDIGTNALLVKNYEEAGDKGMIGYAKHVITSIQQSELMQYSITTPAGTTEGEGYMLIIANANKYGTGVHISEGSVSDGKFEICPVKEMDLQSAIKSGLTAVNLFVDKNMFSEVITCTSAEVKINRKVHMQIDGEYIGETDTLSVSMMPSALNVLIPQ